MFIFQVYLFHHMFCIKIRLENLYSLLQSPVKLSTKSSPWHFFFPFQPKPERGNWQPLGRWAEKQARMWLNTLQEKKGKNSSPSCMVLQNNSCYIWNYLVMVDVNRHFGVCLWRSVLGGFRTRRNSRGEGKTNVCWSREQVESKT